MRISILDRSRTRHGEPDADRRALASTVDRAVRAEQLGFHRFWTAEHHAVPGVAGSAPAVVLAAIGARTSRIRLGTGGIMLPNHSPLVVAEQAMTLEALYSGRFDLGLGGSLGFTAPVREALGVTRLRDGEYSEQIRQVLAYLSGGADLTVRPQTDPPPVYLLAIRGGLALAAEFGLPVVAGGPVLGDADALGGYRKNFRPNAAGDGPYLMVSADVSIAETEQRARDLLLPEAWAQAQSREIGEFRAMTSVDEARRLLERSSAKTREAAQRHVDAAIAGTADQVADQLRDLLERTGAAEVMVFASTYDRDDVAATDEALAGML